MPEIQTRVGSRLQAAGSLEPLLQSLREFIHFNKQVDEDLAQNDAEGGLQVGLTERIQRMVDELSLGA